MVPAFLSPASCGAPWESESGSVASWLVALYGGAVGIWSQPLADVKVYFQCLKFRLWLMLAVILSTYGLA